MGLATALLVGSISFGLTDPAVADASANPRAGMVEILFEDTMTEWSLSQPSGLDQRLVPTFALDGKLVFSGRELTGGQLSLQGESLQLVHVAGDSMELSDLVFSFRGTAGEVYTRSEESQGLFVLSNVESRLFRNGGALLVADMAMGPFMPELAGEHVARVILDVDASAITRKPHRENILDRTPADGTGGGLGGVPDVIVWVVGVDGSNNNDIHYWGQNGGVAAYSIATQSCNQGSAVLDWYDSGGDLRHPVIGQNMFRLDNGRFEQIGQSWLKHGFCAVNEIENGCSPCGSTNCDTLGVGCADTYWATLNDGRGGGSKSYVNATDGTHTHGSPAPTGNNTIRGRLQVAVSDIDPAQNPTAEYFIEGQYVTADDAQEGDSSNNNSWRRVVVNSVNNIDGGGPGADGRRDPAIYAWQHNDPSVQIKKVANNNEPDGIRTYFFLGWKVTSLGSNQWEYEYALQNITSDQGAGSFSIPVPAGVGVSNAGFHDVEYHSGDPYSGDDWPCALAGGSMTWACTPYATDVNANALRWGTLYNYRFVANTPPTTGTATIGLFKPGGSGSIDVTDVSVPSMLDLGERPNVGGHTGPFPGGEIVPNPPMK